MNEQNKKPLSDCVSNFLKRANKLPPKQRDATIRAAQKILQRAIQIEKERKQG